PRPSPPPPPPPPCIPTPLAWNCACKTKGKKKMARFSRPRDNERLRIQMPLQPPWRQPPPTKLSPLPPLVRSSQPPWLTKSPSVGELLVMYSAEEAKKRSATRRAVAKPVYRKQE
ncbi:unnamed protein product, partial [Ixodes pacificus]